MTDVASIQIPLESAPAAGADTHKHVKGSLSQAYAVLIWLPLVAVIVGAAALWHFVSFAFLSNPVLNGLILAVMLWGVATMVGHVWRVYREDRVFFAGLDWLRKGSWSNEPDPRLGPEAYVLGMLTRLEKLGLGHQVYVQSAAMEPELDALEQFFEKKQELSQFLVGLMVGLGLLGTFVGLLETLVATSSLIGTIANSVGGSGTGGGMESEFARIVGGLQKPLSAMGTAFSASMFGLIGSIMLGFQMVIVRKSCSVMVENAREEVLSLAEKTKVNANVEITERFLASLLADMLEQHRQSEERLAAVAAQLTALTPQVEAAALSSQALNRSLDTQTEVLGRTSLVFGQVQAVVPLLGALAEDSSALLRETSSTRTGLDAMLAHLPDQQTLRADLSTALKAMAVLSAEVAESKVATRDLLVEVRLQGSVVKRLESVLWANEKSNISKLLVDEQKR